MQRKKPSITKRMFESRIGLERETVRTAPNGKMSLHPHPEALGSPLTHPHITLDFSEAQLEFTTPPLSSIEAVYGDLAKTEAWVAKNIGAEKLWPASMPPRLPPHAKIPLAHFGVSTAAEKKRLYREGLKQRYGGAMQTISGIHFNFSLTESAWRIIQKKQGNSDPLGNFVNAGYFGIIRNVVRTVPIVAYLFGASPAADKSFFASEPKLLKRFGSRTYVGEYATSLRLSRYGYHNAARGNVKVSFNGLDEYVNDLWYAVSTPSKLWSTLGASGRKPKQLNGNILQLENELYSSIRPKQKSHVHEGESVLCSLACAGVEYVELRVVDLDPFDAVGVSKEQLIFLELFMMHNAITKSAPFKGDEQSRYEENLRTVALLGRKPGLTIYTASGSRRFVDWAHETLANMQSTARLLDEARDSTAYTAVLEKQLRKIDHPECAPSARILEELTKTKLSFVEWGMLKANRATSEMLLNRLGEKYESAMEKIARRSTLEKNKFEARDSWILSGYENLELSTQVLIRAALKRRISVDVLDESLNVVELSRNGKKEVVKQASITRKDNYLSFELMNHKALTKLFLHRAGIVVPQGETFTTKEEALHFYKEHYDTQKTVVVKPTTTNYGIGVSIVEPQDEVGFVIALERAFTEAETVIVEEFAPGLEYRLLVIKDSVVGVVNREPANVVGNGKSTIAELVKEKNANPRFFKLPDKYIRLGVVELEMLKGQKLVPHSVLKSGQKVYLRKNSNVSDGGDPIDVTDDVPAYYKKVAIQAARAVGAVVCGVDMIIPDIKAKQGDYCIIELNWNPAIFMHAFPVQGKPRDVGGAILDVLGF